MNFKKIKKNKIISVLSLAIMINIFAALAIIDLPKVIDYEKTGDLKKMNENYLWAEEKSNMDFQNLLKEAEKGNAEAQYNLAAMYYKGEGIEQDYQKAFNWFEKAVNKEMEELNII